MQQRSALLATTVGQLGRREDGSCHWIPGAREGPTTATQEGSHMSNPFTLVYAGAITRNEPGKVNIHPVTYELNGLDIAANVYTPANYDPEKHFPAVVVAHPNGGVKEQVAGLYAQRLAERGYITIAADTGRRTRILARPFKYTMSSLLDLMRWDATDQLELLDQPLLRIAGSKADSLYMTEDAFAKATGTKDKQLFKIDGATHIETYWVERYVESAMNELTKLFAKTIGA
jgi:fermentation-respiration switch protein FrsA (DUF1100 family)